MTTISDVFRNPAGTGVGGVVVRATLVAASEVLTAGGAIIRETETTTASDGTWSLTLTPIASLAVPVGAYYLITADGHRWTINVPASGTYVLDAVQVVPGPLPPLGAPLASPTFTGTVTLSGRQVSTPDVLTDAATIAVDASLGNDFTVTLGGNRTLGNPTNSVNGQKIMFAIRQDATGGRTLTLGADYRLGTDITAVTLSTAANKTDYLGVRYNAADAKWDVIAFVKGY